MVIVGFRNPNPNTTEVWTLKKCNGTTPAYGGATLTWLRDLLGSHMVALSNTNDVIVSLTFIEGLVPFFWCDIGTVHLDFGPCDSGIVLKAMPYLVCFLSRLPGMCY